MKADRGSEDGNEKQKKRPRTSYPTVWYPAERVPAWWVWILERQEGQSVLWDADIFNQ